MKRLMVLLLIFAAKGALACSCMPHQLLAVVGFVPQFLGDVGRSAAVIVLSHIERDPVSTA